MACIYGLIDAAVCNEQDGIIELGLALLNNALLSIGTLSNFHYEPCTYTFSMLFLAVLSLYGLHLRTNWMQPFATNKMASLN